MKHAVHAGRGLPPRCAPPRAHVLDWACATLDIMALVAVITAASAALGLLIAGPWSFPAGLGTWAALAAGASYFLQGLQVPSVRGCDRGPW